jgi:hypothetical protein
MARATGEERCQAFHYTLITRKLKGAFRGRLRRPILIPLELELFRRGKLRARMTKEQSNSVPENLGRETVHHGQL